MADSEKPKKGKVGRGMDPDQAVNKPTGISRNYFKGQDYMSQSRRAADYTAGAARTGGLEKALPGDLPDVVFNTVERRFSPNIWESDSKAWQRLNLQPNEWYRSPYIYSKDQYITPFPTAPSGWSFPNRRQDFTITGDSLRWAVPSHPRSHGVPSGMFNVADAAEQPLNDIIRSAIRDWARDRAQAQRRERAMPSAPHWSDSPEGQAFMRAQADWRLRFSRPEASSGYTPLDSPRIPPAEQLPATDTHVGFYGFKTPRPAVPGGPFTPDFIAEHMRGIPSAPSTNMPHNAGLPPLRFDVADVPGAGAPPRPSPFTQSFGAGPSGEAPWALPPPRPGKKNPGPPLPGGPHGGAGAGPSSSELPSPYNWSADWHRNTPFSERRIAELYSPPFESGNYVAGVRLKPYILNSPFVNLPARMYTVGMAPAYAYKRNNVPMYDAAYTYSTSPYLSNESLKAMDPIGQAMWAWSRQTPNDFPGANPTRLFPPAPYIRDTVAGAMMQPHTALPSTATPPPKLPTSSGPIHINDIPPRYRSWVQQLWAEGVDPIWTNIWKTQPLPAETNLLPRPTQPLPPPAAAHASIARGVSGDLATGIAGVAGAAAGQALTNIYNPLLARYGTSVADIQTADDAKHAAERSWLYDRMPRPVQYAADLWTERDARDAAQLKTVHDWLTGRRSDPTPAPKRPVYKPPAPPPLRFDPVVPLSTRLERPVYGPPAPPPAPMVNPFMQFQPMQAGKPAPNPFQFGNVMPQPKPAKKKAKK